MRKLLKPAIIFLLVFGVLFVGLLLVAKQSTKSEWDEKVSGRRTSAEIKGLLISLADFNSDPANVLPQAILHKEMCSASVTNMVNFIVGEENLKSVPAWLFSKANAGKVKKVYDRQKDFSIEGDRIVENYDRGFRLGSILDDDKMYILAYHYIDTVSDTKIINAGGDYNSHLMLLLPMINGKRLGYHLIHYPEDEWYKNPVHVEAVDQMPAKLDLVHIMEVVGVDLSKKPKELFMVNKSMPYATIRALLVNLPFGIEYYLNTVTVFLVNLWYGTEQFPTIIDLEERDVIKVPYNGGLYHGKIMGFYNKVPIYYHDPKFPSARGNYGMLFQCVEFVNRYLVSKAKDDLTKTGHADSYYWQAKTKGLISFPNGGTEKPRVDDLLVFDNGNDDGSPGHVAVIYSVTDRYICFVQQNVGDVWKDCLPLRTKENKWIINSATTVAYKKVGAPVVGWSRTKKGE